MLTYGIFLFLDIFFIIHAKGLAHVPEEQMENTELMPLGMAKELDENEYPSFELCLSDNWDSPLVAQHKQWLKTIRHETPNPKIPFKVAVYIRYFNQTKYDDYLERNKEVFRATLAQYPMWEFVGFYIDNGSTAPNMESAVAWSELLSDCDEGKVNLIITQKISNVSRKIHEVSICARMLAARNPPVGIYFISEDMYTLASYYREDLREPCFFPTPDWEILPDDELDLRGMLHE
jgi:putative DNA recombinase